MRADRDEAPQWVQLAWTDTPADYSCKEKAFDYRAAVSGSGSPCIGFVVGTPGAGGIIATLDAGGENGTDVWIPASVLTACPYQRGRYRGFKATATINSVERTTTAHDLVVYW